MIVTSIVKNSLTLGVFAVVTTGLVVGTNILTRNDIEKAEEIARKKALHEVSATQPHGNKLTFDTIRIDGDPGLGSATTRDAYIAIQNNTPEGIILPITAPEGYSGSINLLVGINANGNITGVRVIPPHYETPGLGDKIDIQKADWITSFNGKSLSNTPEKNWKVKKDGGEFDAFTGATITPRAVVDAVHKSLLYFKEYQADLLNPAPKEIKHPEETN
jgi:electron transport complex protein RnfG